MDDGQLVKLQTTCEVYQIHTVCHKKEETFKDKANLGKTYDSQSPKGEREFYNFF